VENQAGGDRRVLKRFLLGLHGIFFGGIMHNCEFCVRGGDIPIVELHTLFPSMNKDAFKLIILGQHIVCTKLSEKYGATIMMPRNADGCQDFKEA